MARIVTIGEAIEDGFGDGTFVVRKIAKGWTPGEVVGYITAITVLNYSARLLLDIDTVLKIARAFVQEYV